VLQIADAVTSGQHIEDSRVELKATWPVDPQRAARRIAGHANAARGEDILWIVGLDEKDGAQGATASDTASWWASVAKHFDEATPTLQDVAVVYGGVTLVALRFECDAAPFVIATGQGGAVAREVSWRDGTSTRSAHRSELLRMLVPQIARPTFEVLSASVKVEEDYNQRDVCDWEFAIRAYCQSPRGHSTVIPWHQLSAWLFVPDAELLQKADRAWITGYKAADASPYGGLWTELAPIALATIHTGAAQVIIEGPGLIDFHGRAEAAVPTAAVQARLLEKDVTGQLVFQWTALDDDQERELRVPIAYRSDWHGLDNKLKDGTVVRSGKWAGRWSMGDSGRAGGLSDE
jgi:hypothetical protein